MRNNNNNDMSLNENKEELTMTNINEEREALVNKMERAGRAGDMETFMKVSREITELEANNPGLESAGVEEVESEVSLNKINEEESEMSKERMQFLVDEINSLTKKKEEMKLNNVPLWNWPNQEGKLIQMYVDEIAEIKQNNKEEKKMDTHKETKLVEIFIERLNKREKEREEEIMKRKIDTKQIKEELTMRNRDKVSTELELLNELMNHTTKQKEMEIMKVETMEQEAENIRLEEIERQKEYTKIEAEVADKEMEVWKEEVSSNPVFGKKEEEEANMTTNKKKELIAAKGLVVGVNHLVTSNLLGEVESKRLSVTVQEVAAALVAIEKSGKQVDKLKERIIKKLGNETYKSVLKRGGDRKVFNEVWKNVENIANQYYLNNKEEANVITKEEKMNIMQQEAKEIQEEEMARELNHIQEEEEETIKMDLQFFGNKVEEESAMLKQIQKFNGIAKQIEEIDEAGGDVYIGGVNVSWDSVKQFVYGLSDDELKLLAYSNKPEIPAELEAYAIYLLEAEKAWDNELTMQNSYFNSKKNISMDLQFFAKGETNKNRVSEAHTLALSHIEILDKQRENLLSFLEGRKEDELTSSIEEELSNVESSIKRWGSIHSKSLHSRVKEGAIKLGRSY